MGTLEKQIASRFSAKRYGIENYPEMAEDEAGFVETFGDEITESVIDYYRNNKKELMQACVDHYDSVIQVEGQMMLVDEALYMNGLGLFESTQAHIADEIIRAVAEIDQATRDRFASRDDNDYEDLANTEFRWVA